MPSWQRLREAQAIFGYFGFDMTHALGYDAGFRSLGGSGEGSYPV